MGSQVPGRKDLQGIVALALVFAFLAAIGVGLYLVVVGKIKPDAGVFQGFFITAVGTALGWLFGRERKA